MAKKDYSVAEATAIITRNGHRVETPGNDDPQVMIIKTFGPIGIRVWSAIDYLVNHKSHMHLRA